MGQRFFPDGVPGYFHRVIALRVRRQECHIKSVTELCL
jgi:hypothetical protein